MECRESIIEASSDSDDERAFAPARTALHRETEEASATASAANRTSRTWASPPFTKKKWQDTAEGADNVNCSIEEDSGDEGTSGKADDPPRPLVRGHEVPSSAELSKESTVQTSNRPRLVASSSQCSSSSQFSTQKDLMSAYTPNTTETNSMFGTSESEEAISNIAARYNRLLEVSTVSYASTETSVSAPFDDSLLDPSAAFNFAMEHRIFLNAALNLLNEKDSTATELGMRDPIILKAGSLKKASQVMNGVWKVKYVEVRRGMFSYYEKNTVSSTDDDRQGELLLRKNIPLEASICTCRAVKLHQKALNFSPGGAIFELASSNSSTIRRLWMATSREERQAWIQAINNAMVGGSVTRGDAEVDHRGLVRTISGRSPFKVDLRKYTKCQAAIRSARTATEYLGVMRELLDQPLNVPIKWIAKQGSLLADSSTGHGNSNGNAFQEETVELSIDQLWRDLQRDSVCVNGEVLRGDNGHGPERILGALTRCLLQVGQNQDNGVGLPSNLRESKALRYARDILLAGNRTRTGGDSYYSVNALCGHGELVVVVPSGVEVEPVKIQVTEDDSDKSFHQRFIDKSGWIKTKTRIQRTWRKHFFVLSEGTLSAYQGATPRPYGLKSQGAIADASVSISKESRNGGTESDDSNNANYIVTIATKDGPSKEYLLLFESVDKLVDWVYAFECVMKAKPARQKSGANTQIENKSHSLNKVLSLAEHSTLEHTKTLGLDQYYVKRRLEKVSQRATVALRVSVEATTYYKVCTTDPTGDDELDTWATIEAQFVQPFQITGGPNSQIRRGEEIVDLRVSSCLHLPVANGATPNTEGGAGPVSPTTMRSRLNRRIFRHPSSNDESELPVSGIKEFNSKE